MGCTPNRTPILRRLKTWGPTTGALPVRDAGGPNLYLKGPSILPSFFLAHSVSLSYLALVHVPGALVVVGPRSEVGKHAQDVVGSDLFVRRMIRYSLALCFLPVGPPPSAIRAGNIQKHLRSRGMARQLIHSHDSTIVTTFRKFPLI